MDKGNKKDARRLYISCLELYNRRDCCTNAPIDSLRSPLPPLRRGRGPRAVNVNQSHVANARVLGSFSHTTCFPISYPLWACFSDRSVSGE